MKFRFILIFLVISLLLPLAVFASDSSCVACHTKGRQLVEITREISKTRPAPAVSVESVGEG